MLACLCFCCSASDVAGLREALDAHVAASASSSDVDRRMHITDQTSKADEHNKVEIHGIFCCTIGVF